MQYWNLKIIRKLKNKNSNSELDGNLRSTQTLSDRLEKYVNMG